MQEEILPAIARKGDTRRFFYDVATLVVFPCGKTLVIPKKEQARFVFVNAKLINK